MHRKGYAYKKAGVGILDLVHGGLTPGGPVRQRAPPAVPSLWKFWTGSMRVRAGRRALRILASVEAGSLGRADHFVASLYFPDHDHVRSFAVGDVPVAPHSCNTHDRGSESRDDGEFTVPLKVRCLCLGRDDISDRLQQAAAVEPVHPLLG